MSIRQRCNYTYMVAAIILLVGVVRLPVDSMRALFALSFRIGVVALFAVFLFEKVNRWAGALLALGLFSHLFPKYTQSSYLALDWLVLGLGLYAFIVLKCSNTERLLDAICILTFVMVLFLTLQAFGIDPYRLFYRVFSGTVNDTGLMANRNETSAFLAIAAPAFYRAKWFYLIPVVLAGLYFARGFGGAAGFGMGLVFFASCYGHRFWPATVLCVALIGWSYYRDHPGAAPRWYPIWKPALGIYKDHWLIGCGIGNWKEVYPTVVKYEIMTNGWIRLHNTFIQATMEMGIGFVAIVAGYLVSTFKRAADVQLKTMAMPLAALVGILAMGNVNSMFRVNAINAMIAVVWLAILQIQLKQKEACLN